MRGFHWFVAVEITLATLIVGSVFLANRGGFHFAQPAGTPTAEVKPVTTDTPPPSKDEPKPATKREARVKSVWDAKVHYQPDSPPTNCAVAGQVRLFAANEDRPQKGNGTLIVMLLDCTPQSGVNEPTLIEEWRIEADTLQHFLATDSTEAVYSLVLPWSTYKPDIASMRVDVKYDPKEGSSLFAQGEILRIDHGEMKERAR